MKAEYDVVVKQEEARVREAGGLHGSVPNGMSPAGGQPAAGRAGRQGDPGSTASSVFGRQPLRIFGVTALPA